MDPMPLNSGKENHDDADLQEEQGQCENTTKESRRQLTCLESIVPDNCPLPWIGINIICCLSCVLIFLAILDTDGPLDRPYGTKLYVCWAVITNILWLVEVGLIVWYRVDSRYAWIHKVEFLLAVYFMIGSFDMLTSGMIWQEPDEDLDGELIDVVISGAAYSFELTLQCLYYSQGQSPYADPPGSADSSCQPASLCSGEFFIMEEPPKLEDPESRKPSAMGVRPVLQVD
jgi:hypothetical protein